MMDYSWKEEAALQLGMKSRDLQVLSGGLQNRMCEYTENQSVLRVSSSNRRSKEELLAEQDWLEYLARADVRINKPKAFRDGERIKEIHLKGKPFLVTQFEKVEGALLTPEVDSHWNIKVFREWGRVAGELHKVSKTLNLSTNRQQTIIHKVQKNEDKLYSKLRVRDKKIGENYQKLILEINELPQTEHCYGLIHGDLHHGNLLYSGERVYLIDADDFGYSWFAEDIATTLYHVNWHGKSIHPAWTGLVMDFWEAFIEGYASEYAIDNEMAAALPLFLRKREFFLYNLFLKIWDLMCLEVWQTHTLAKLEDNLKNERVPFQLT